MSEVHEAVRSLLGGYLLGGLDEIDQRQVDAHVRHCPLCRDELDLLGPVPDLLKALPMGMPVETPAVPLDNLLRKVRARRRTRTLLATAAAVLVVVVATVAFALRPGEPSGTTVTFAAAPAAGTTGRAVLTGHPWGTSIAVTLRNLPPAGVCVLQVAGRDGRVEQAATWGPTVTGTAQLTGATSVALAAVHSVTVLDGNGRVLATATVT